MRAWRRQIALSGEEGAALIHAENGKPLDDARVEVLGTLEHLQYAADNAARVLRRREIPASPTTRSVGCLSGGAGGRSRCSAGFGLGVGVGEATGDSAASPWLLLLESQCGKHTYAAESGAVTDCGPSRSRLRSWAVRSRACNNGSAGCVLASDAALTGSSQ
ncbi:hypothetical protein [Streptomyces sp. NPDC058268]|uniref:hypothetical protein n=1 Tax=Streptomyces sp. NPDC058268 TaxID=3346413 RepID=UPI0036F07A0D